MLSYFTVLPTMTKVLNEVGSLYPNTVQGSVVSSVDSHLVTVSAIAVETIGGGGASNRNIEFDGDNSNNNGIEAINAHKTPTKRPMLQIELPNVSASPREVNLTRLASNELTFDEGYDSDGHAGPWCQMEEFEGEQEFEEADLREIETVSNDTGENKEEIEVGVFIPVEEDAINKMSVKQLKVELRLRILPVGGNKGALIDRLTTALKAKTLKYFEGYTKPKTIIEKKAPGMSGFPLTAWWRILQPDEQNIVQEPQNPSFSKSRSPTMEPDVKYIKQKQNFFETFKVPIFTGIYNKFVQTKRKGKNKKFVSYF